MSPSDRPTSMSGTPRKVANRSRASTGVVASESAGATAGKVSPTTTPSAMAVTNSQT